LDGYISFPREQEFKQQENQSIYLFFIARRPTNCLNFKMNIIFFFGELSFLEEPSSAAKAGR
jgi:hypothetical protein